MTEKNAYENIKENIKNINQENIKNINQEKSTAESNSLERTEL